MPGEVITRRNYEGQLIDFEPKMRSTVRNFRLYGHQFDGHDDDDLVQELFVHGIELFPKYDPSRGAAVRTFWYRCFRTKLVVLAEARDKAMLWACRMPLIRDWEYREPMVALPNEWPTAARAAVETMMQELTFVDPDIARLARTIMDLDGDKIEAGRVCGLTLDQVEMSLTKLRVWRGTQLAMDCIPF
jgi:DNA-directed RNA polymerase specialized sigma24 family protein